MSIQISCGSLTQAWTYQKWDSKQPLKDLEVETCAPTESRLPLVYGPQREQFIHSLFMSLISVDLFQTFQITHDPKKAMRS